MQTSQKLKITTPANENQPNFNNHISAIPYTLYAIRYTLYLPPQPTKIKQISPKNTQKSPPPEFTLDFSSLAFEFTLGVCSLALEFIPENHYLGL